MCGKRINFMFCINKRVFFVSEQAFPCRKEKFDCIKYVQGKIVSKWEIKDKRKMKTAWKMSKEKMIVASKWRKNKREKKKWETI